VAYRSVYTDSYLRPETSGSRYDHSVGNSFEMAIYRLEQALLRRIFRDRFGSNPHTRYLDFACGTGRILSIFRTLATSRTGVDTSAGQLEAAREKDPDATLICGNVVTDPGLLDDQRFDLITCFRLFLNLEPEHRVPILRRLRELLAPGGHLIVDNHMNRYSALGIMALAAHWVLRIPRKPFVPPGRRGVISTMSEREMRGALAAAGFEVEEVVRFCVMPGHGAFTVLPAGPLLAVERLLARIPLVNRAAKNQVFVCRAAPPSAP
jgi:2-polyprenyl-3-methyl-5-hydroxy-6-metoxy-1,4-benzoquinol methylase